MLPCGTAGQHCDGPGPVHAGRHGPDVLPAAAGVVSPARPGELGLGVVDGPVSFKLGRDAGHLVRHDLPGRQAQHPGVDPGGPVKKQRGGEEKIKPVIKYLAYCRSQTREAGSKALMRYLTPFLSAW